MDSTVESYTAEKRAEYKVVGFDDYTVTDGGKVFRIRHFKRKMDRVEVHADGQGLISMYIGSKRECRVTLEKLITAATCGLDPRSDELDELMRKKLRDALLPTLAEKVDSSKGQLARIEALTSEVETAILSELRSRDAVNDASQMLANVTAHSIVLLYRIWNDLARAESLDDVELSREGNERRSAHHLIKAAQEQQKVVLSSLAQLGIEYKDIRKTVAGVADAGRKGLFDDSDCDVEYEII